jgi:hypothetical protein
MITRSENIVTIECDKCHKQVSGTEETYNKAAWDAGFALNRGRKYMHLCYDCLPKDKQEAMDFAHKNFTF